MASDPEIRLSVGQLRELIERAESQNYMIVQTTEGQWVQVSPYVPGVEIGHDHRPADPHHPESESN
jgi:hypothetical protein